MASVDVNALGQAIDTSWGRSSTPLTSMYAVKLRFGPGFTIIAQLNMHINVGNRASIIQARQKYTDETAHLINAVLKKVKAEYKDICGGTVTFKEVSEDNDIEMIGSLANPRRQALFKKTMVFEYL